MKIISTVKKLRQEINKLKKQGCRVGFVPTMGFLHQGHASLLRQSKKETDITVLSIFVNPLQFGPGEDLNKYPRDLKKDEMLAKKENVDIIFCPSVDEVYPTGFLTHVTVGVLSERMCGVSRPGHFQGVATVVLKLINMVNPDIMYLGQKDAQQAIIIRKMIEDLNVPIAIKIMPTVRESDGLAMSSRNSYLSESQRQEAAILFQSLKKAKEFIDAGEHSVDVVLALIREMITTQSQGIIDYIECVAAKDLSVVKSISGEVLIALAVRFGRARLIDNILVRVNGQTKKN